MRIVVFGGGGFLGSWIVDRLLEDGHELRVFERPRVPAYRAFRPGERVEWRWGDFSSAFDVSDAIRGCDAVVHLVSTTLPKSSNDDPAYDVQTNVVATLQMLNSMVQLGVGRIVFISSGGTVYGRPEYLPIDERHPTEPLVSYGVTKLAIEKYLRIFDHMHGIRPVILRVANPYGERQRVETAQGAVGVFMSRALRGQPIEIWGDGTVQRDYLHASDVAEAFNQALHYEGPSRCFNISSGLGVSLNELIGQIEQSLGRHVERVYMPGRPFDVPVSVLSNALAGAELGWVPRVSLDEGLARTAKWMAGQVAGA